MVIWTTLPLHFFGAALTQLALVRTSFDLVFFQEIQLIHEEEMKLKMSQS